MNWTVTIATRAQKPIGRLPEEIKKNLVSVPWRACFSYADEQLPSISLAGAREKEGLTQREVSRLTGIPQRRISEMENGKRPIEKETAKRLGKALNISYEVFL